MFRPELSAFVRIAQYGAIEGTVKYRAEDVANRKGKTPFKNMYKVGAIGLRELLATTTAGGPNDFVNSIRYMYRLRVGVTEFNVTVDQTNNTA